MSGPNDGSVQRSSDVGHSSLSHQQQINGLERDHHHHHHQSVPQGLLMKGKNKENTSDEDETSFDDVAKGCPWQRMKWTDEIVRLLITVVAHVGDDCTLEGGTQGLKRKSGYLQKKGKWKTISKIMIKSGCHVSPQQCEDKFSDLNKRYKRLNDILGKRICCQVVENPNLMDSMPQLSSKAKDDVKKILSSKHLFYQEICAYHNGQRIPNCPDLNLQEFSANVEKEDGEAEANDDPDDDHDPDDDDSDSDHEDDDEQVAKDQDTNFDLQMMGKSTLEKREWITMQRFQLQERKLQIQEQSLELEKQRFKWLRYSSKKQREMERLRLVNERMNLENERLDLQLTKKELEIGSKREERKRPD